jgi:hypothetical protein
MTAATVDVEIPQRSNESTVLGRNQLSAVYEGIEG